MKPQYSLQVISTGETITTKYSDRPMYSWQKVMERRALKDKRRTEEIKQSIRALDTIVAWVNYDLMRNSLTETQLDDICKVVFRNYDKFFEERTQSC